MKPASIIISAVTVSEARFNTSNYLFYVHNFNLANATSCAFVRLRSYLAFWLVRFVTTALKVDTASVSNI
jgi:hypothetical protein